ncbi:aminopeptidase [Hoeflea poritis]|uniref:Aminopeptidase n=1 Tax=Hoeflea poritis TaxID=2993659 RepID=A0ABT4VPW6_9HYPH|nr:aminopeptidase [Hoeflea poritis]MDA4846753.1 aminopeptidase [Hoeflea poritis]
MPSHLRLLPVALLSLPLLSGCESLSYYSQSLGGHLELVNSGQRIDRLIADPRSAPDLRAQLTEARAIRAFASERLALPDNNSYRSYVDTGREFVSWAVFATPELSLEVRTWCFPIVGCVPYRGYFSRQEAFSYAKELADGGDDVYVAGIPAYSTLGWTSDPLLNTMFLRGDTYLASVVFHELTHQVVYVRGDAAFNEAFAVSVEDSGTVLWLEHKDDKAGLKRYRLSQRRNADFQALVARTREELHGIYTGNGSDAEKRAEKAAAIERLRARYRRLKTRKWDGYSGYDAWFSEPINNAKLATISVYNDLEPAFSRLLELCASDYGRYYEAVRRIGRLDFARRREVLEGATRCD